MSGTIDIKGTISVAFDITATQKRAIYTNQLSISQAITEGEGRKIIVPNSTVDEEIEMSNISPVTFVFISSTKAVSIKVNGSSVAITGTIFIFPGTSAAPVTAILVSNASGEDAVLDIVVGG